ncbi:hypothetical protein HH1059_11140 [Halorhodospira halochloris]|uniref:DUF2442 domain-containing protein n=2 Tax=Halorhodospira halochloris TaxID=1052 RepID=A0A2Z6EZI0_HALHR|nr:DUF2442 domain-containing protein [Halorhodospira halochloris]MBK1652407.1 death-on-curing protein [Halorhodospira halochloris]BBE11041.1 hypothetical protein HH1059_11140 [Halorhodospira halochloris]
MWDFNDVVRLEYKGEYTYFVEFDDGVSGIVDFSSLLERGPVFSALKDKKVFSQARIEGGTIAWPNGADIAPETLYRECEQAGSGDALQRA